MCDVNLVADSDEWRQRKRRQGNGVRRAYADSMTLPLRRRHCHIESVFVSVKCLFKCENVDDIDDDSPMMVME